MDDGLRMTAYGPRCSVYLYNWAWVVVDWLVMGTKKPPVTGTGGSE